MWDILKKGKKEKDKKMWNIFKKGGKIMRKENVKKEKE